MARAFPSAVRRLGPLLVAAAALAAACSRGASREEPVCPPARPEASPELRAFLESYFASWSRGDMQGYADHFLGDAVVMYVADGEVRSSMELAPFIEQQAAMQAEEESRAEERMTGLVADEDGHAATATVDWVLERGEMTQRGVDRFTLVRDAEGGFKIATLVFYATRRREP
jgi:ketosteroid isomerase-like protein